MRTTAFTRPGIISFFVDDQEIIVSATINMRSPKRRANPIVNVTPGQPRVGPISQSEI